MKTGDKVVTNLGTGFVVKDHPWIEIKLDSGRTVVFGYLKFCEVVND